MVLTIRTKKRVFALGKAEDYVFELTPEYEPEISSKVFVLWAKKPGASYELYAYPKAEDAGNAFSSIVAALSSGIPVYEMKEA